MHIQTILWNYLTFVLILKKRQRGVDIRESFRQLYCLLPILPLLAIIPHWLEQCAL